MTTSEVQQLIIDTSNRYGVPPNLALGVASHESGFNPNAVNTANPNGTKDWGVMQLNDTTIQTMGVLNPLDPQQNVDAGVRLLASLLARYNGDSRQALWAYASGPGNVGPTKTPNQTAEGFINYVTAYDAGGFSIAPDTSLDSSIADIINPFAENGSIDWGLIALVGLVGFGIWYTFSD